MKNKNYVESVPPSNPLSNSPDTNEYATNVVPGKKLKDSGNAVMFSHELCSPDAKSYHHRYHTDSMETKHSKAMAMSPHGFRKHQGEFSNYSNAAVRSERMATWQSASQRKTLEEERYAMVLPGPGNYKVNGFKKVSTKNIFVPRNNRANACTNSNTVSSPSSCSSPNASPDGSKSSSRRKKWGTFAELRAPSPTRFEITSVDIQPYDIDDDISMTSHLSQATALKSRHNNARLNTISQFQHAFDKAKEEFRTEQVVTRELKRWKPKSMENDKSISEEVRNDLLAFEIKNPNADYLKGLNKEQLEQLINESQSFKEEYVESLKKPVYTRKERECIRQNDLLMRQSAALIATGGASKFLSRAVKAELNMMSPKKSEKDAKSETKYGDAKEDPIENRSCSFARESDICNSNDTDKADDADEGLEMASGYEEIDEEDAGVHGLDHLSVNTTIGTSFRLPKASTLGNCIDSMLEASPFPTVIFTNMLLQTIVKQIIKPAKAPSISEETRPPTSQFETFHAQERYDVHVYGSQRSVVVLLLCWADLGWHPDMESYQDSATNEKFYWFAPKNSAIISNVKPIGKIILTKDRMEEFVIPHPPTRIAPAVRHPALQTLSTENLNDTKGSPRATAGQNADIDRVDAEADELRSIQLEWVRWLVGLKHRVVVEKRPRLSSLRASIACRTMDVITRFHEHPHEDSHALSPSATHDSKAFDALSPKSFVKKQGAAMQAAGIDAFEFNVILCRPKVPTNIKGFRWPLVGDTEMGKFGTVCGTGAGSGNVVSKLTHSSLTANATQHKYKNRADVRPVDDNYSDIASEVEHTERSADIAFGGGHENESDLIDCDNDADISALYAVNLEIANSVPPSKRQVALYFRDTAGGMK